jgi:dihydrofolate synthase/folylpolyglutamate synthase
MRSIQKKALLAPQPYSEVVEVARKIASDVEATLVLSEEVGGRSEELGGIAEAKGWPDYLIDNAAVALHALELLDIPYNIDDLYDLKLFGRFYPLRENIRIDVGHNPLAAGAIVKAMAPDTVLIYNSLDDKDYEEVLRTLKPKVKRVEIIPIESQRATTREKIEEALERVGIPYEGFSSRIDEREHYLVFGSFYTVEAFLKAVGFKNE